MIKASRKINWVSTIRPNAVIDELEKKLYDFYSHNSDYYNDIDFTEDNWLKEAEKGYLKILELVSLHESVCEIGCGNANILKHFPQMATKYTGLDFSKKVIQKNSAKYPTSNFIKIIKANLLPVDDQQFDLVFSVFVLEHVAYPAVFLKECLRILKKGGTLIIFCPDFLGRGRMTSQRSGFSAGNSFEKIKKGKILDSIVTLFDNRIRIPFICWKFRKRALKTPLFLVNTSPVVFEESFQPDADAVYLTYKEEICKYLHDEMSIVKNGSSLENYLFEKKLIFLQLVKTKS